MLEGARGNVPRVAGDGVVTKRKGSSAR